MQKYYLCQCSLGLYDAVKRESYIQFLNIKSRFSLFMARYCGVICRYENAVKYLLQL